MKNLLILSSLLVVLFLGCKKTEDQSYTPDEKTYSVTFDASTLTTHLQDYSKAGNSVSELGDTLKNYCRKLNYHLFRADGTYLRTIWQQEGMGQGVTGIVKDDLVAGSYIALFIGYEGAFIGENPTDLPNLFMETWYIFWPGVYMKRIDFTVSNSNIVRNVRMTRVTGAVDVNIEDALPVNAARITLEAIDDVKNLYFVDSTRNTFHKKYQEFTISADQKGQTNTRFVMNVINTFKPFTLVIKCQDKFGGVLSQKVVNNVMCYKNRKTMLSGKLFSPSTSSSVEAGAPLMQQNTDYLKF
jgi:hypothetical protein